MTEESHLVLKEFCKKRVLIKFTGFGGREKFICEERRFKRVEREQPSAHEESMRSTCIIFV